MTITSPLLESRLPYPRRAGKVRDVYDLGNELILVATDRISAFDCVMPNGIPEKGAILTALSLFFFNRTRKIVDNHLIATDVTDFPAAARSFGDQLIGRSVLVKKTKVIPFECVVRGYLAGSAWSEYKTSGTVNGRKMPRGIKQCGKLPEPIFTPATKAQIGHDINISLDQMRSRIGRELTDRLMSLTLAIYNDCAAYAAERGVIVADTKFEFGQLADGSVILIDELMTPDSSRFWPADDYKPGREQASFDKQFVRDWLESQPWDKKPPAPPLPPDVITGTHARYCDAYRLLTGRSWRS